jgi:hypothetical protein
VPNALTPRALGYRELEERVKPFNC